MRRLSVPTGLPVGNVNVYVEEGQSGVVLVDTGPDTPETRAVLERNLAREGIRVRDIREIWITHPHVDHLGLAPFLQAASGARVMGAPETAQWLRNWNEMWDGRLEGARGFLGLAGAPERDRVASERSLLHLRALGGPLSGVIPVDDGQVLSGRRVVRVDGHARGQLAFVGEDDVLTGDHLIRHVSSNPIVEPPGEGGIWPSMVGVQIRSLKASTTWKGLHGLSGHGRTIEDAGILAEERLLEIGERKRTVLRLVDGRRTFWEIAEALFPDLSPGDAFLALSEVAGHLFRLRDEGEVIIGETAGQFVPRIRERA